MRGSWLLACVLAAGCGDIGLQVYGEGPVAVGTTSRILFEDGGCNDPLHDSCHLVRIREIRELTVDPNFEIVDAIVGDISTVIRVRALSAGKATLHMRALVDSDERTFDLMLDARDANSIDVSVPCNGESPFPVPTDIELAVGIVLLADGVSLAGSGYRPIVAENLTEVRTLGSTGVVYKLPSATSVARITTPIDPAYVFQLDVLAPADFDAIGGVPNLTPLPVSSATMVDLHAVHGGRRACVQPDGPWNITIKTSATCGLSGSETNVLTTTVQGPHPTFKLYGRDHGTCQIEVALMGTSLVTTIDVPVCRVGQCR